MGSRSRSSGKRVALGDCNGGSPVYGTPSKSMGLGILG